PQRRTSPPERRSVDGWPPWREAYGLAGPPAPAPPPGGTARGGEPLGNQGLSVRPKKAGRAERRPPLRPEHGGGDTRHRARPEDGRRRRDRVQAAVLRRVPQRVRRGRRARRGDRTVVGLADRAEERRVRLRLGDRPRFRPRASCLRR